MKYLNGGWLTKSGYEVKFGSQLYDAKIYDDKIELFLPYKKVENMGDTLNSGILTVEITSPMPDIITARVYNFTSRKDNVPKFKLNKQDSNIEIIDQENEYIFSSGNTRLIIKKGAPINFRYEYLNKEIATSTWNSKAFVTDDLGNPHVTDEFILDVDEKIYGLGERFGNFVKNGQSVSIWNEDGGTSTEQAYKNIPFYVSSKNYGLFVNSTDKVEFEIGSDQVSRVQFSVPGQSLEYSVIGASNMKDVLRRYTDYTGKPTLPPAWSFGLWLTTSFTTSYDEKTVLSFIDGMADNDIPLSVFHFDTLWMKEFELCNFEWDKSKFPHPEELIKKIHERGVKVCVWINPYIAQKSKLFDEALKNNFLIKYKNGDVWQWDLWQAGMGIVDFTNPEAVKWFQSKLQKLLDIGVDCFKTDFGERIPSENVQFFDGSKPSLMHNYYTNLYNQAVFELLQKERGDKDAVLFARSATVGGQKYPVHWGGDSSSDYPSMAETLRAGLSIGLSGFGYWSHDISGFEDAATPDLYKRWTQFGLLSSHSRYHGSSQYKVPWLFDDEAVDVSRKYTKLKLKLMPYIWQQAINTSYSGLPMLRAMALEFQDDINCRSIDTQYMFGSELLIAPIFNDQGVCNFYVPKSMGNWTNILTGELYGSGEWHLENYDYSTLPLLARPGSVIVMGQDDHNPEYDYLDNPQIHYYVPSINEYSSFSNITNFDQKRHATIEINKQDENIKFNVKGIKFYELYVHTQSGETIQLNQDKKEISL